MANPETGRRGQHFPEERGNAEPRNKEVTGWRERAGQKGRTRHFWIIKVRIIQVKFRVDW